MFQQEFEKAKQILLQAADKIMERTDFQVFSDTGKDIKLEADLVAETYIIKELHRASDYPIIAEESGISGEHKRGAAYWVVDPLDGTLNFSRGIPFHCISIALWKDNSPIFGVIFDFTRSELFSGMVGQGAWLNDKLVIVSDVKQREKAILTTGFPSFRDYDDNAVTSFVKSVQDFKKVRLLGAAALSMAYVACGRVDAYAEEDIRFWDVAAGIALVQAAGGHVNYSFSTTKEYTLTVQAAAHPDLWAN